MRRRLDQPLSGERKGRIMSVSLTDVQLVMMSAAAQREDRCLAAPETMKGAVVGKASAKLVKLGFAREILAKPGALASRRNRAELCAQIDGGRVESDRRRGGTARRDRARRGVAASASS